MLRAFASFISKSPVIQSYRTYIFFLHHLSTMTETFSQEFHLREEHGDLFSCPENEALAHCVSQDFAMGKGIALEFKKQFGGVAELKRQGKSVGDVATLKRDHRYIYYLITKERYYQKPTYANLRMSLSAMKKHCLENGVKRISMPKIGCGLDMLEWEKVKKEITDLFKDSPITVTVYLLEVKNESASIVGIRPV